LVHVFRRAGSPEAIWCTKRGNSSGPPGVWRRPHILQAEVGDELVARGLPNREIAKALVVEESTIRTHVKRILTKLELHDRIQIVIFAYETGVNRPAAG
jgi:hypothetical protein